jgi:hypothetical protein
MNLQNNNLQVVPVLNQTPPDSGQVALKLVLDFTTQTEWDVDLTPYIQQGKLTSIQTMYIDAGDNNAPIKATFPAPGFRVIAPANSQGFYPVLTQNPTSVKFESAGTVVTVFLLNFPLPGQSWRTV